MLPQGNFAWIRTFSSRLACAKADPCSQTLSASVITNTPVALSRARVMVIKATVSLPHGVHLQ
ncbi:hypothetical protein BSY19_789 [Bosea sp. RAC05]|jgi:hypothetical protein|nr:hypothetical protein BSY19_789 [Bosea sp. RAC05]